MRSLWVALTRPDNLPLAVAVAEALREGFPGGVFLVREPSAWWDRARWEPLRERFAAVHDVPRIASCRGLRDLPRLVRETNARQRGLGALPAGPQDVAVCLAGLTGLANAVVSAWAQAGRARPALVVPRKKWDDLRCPIDRRRFRWTTPGWLANRVVEPVAGLHRTVHLKPRRRAGGDGVRLVRFEAEPGEIFGAAVLLSHGGTGRQANVGPGVFPAPFPDLAALGRELGLTGSAVRSGSGEERRRVLFFGTPFLLVRNLTPEVYAAGLNRCLDYLRRHYPDCELIYRPHPAETGEAARLHLEGFRVDEDREVAELLFLKEAPEIAAVYSVSSTVSRVALGAGLDAYCLWRTFPFSPTNARYFETLMGSVPAEFDVRDLSQPPVPYAGRRESPGGTFAKALRNALEGCRPLRP